MTPSEFIAAARVPHSLREAEFGPWTIRRMRADSESLAGVIERLNIGFDDYCLLHRITDATMHTPPGEVVMEDSRRELQRHLPIWLAARGRVLVTGLGLGCVVRGLLASPAVVHVDVVEIDGGIMSHVGAEFLGHPRCTLHEADALTIEWPEGTRWDCAWHDIWCDGPGLQRLHAKLIWRYVDRVAHQGAWMLPRFASRAAPRMKWIGQPRRRPC